MMSHKGVDRRCGNQVMLIIDGIDGLVGTCIVVDNSCWRLHWLCSTIGWWWSDMTCVGLGPILVLCCWLNPIRFLCKGRLFPIRILCKRLYIRWSKVNGSEGNGLPSKFPWRTAAWTAVPLLALAAW